MFKDLKTFYKKTKDDNKRVICLTATADDGYEKGSERKALEVLDFKVYHNSEKSEEAEPKIHGHVKIDCSE